MTTTSSTLPTKASWTALLLISVLVFPACESAPDRHQTLFILAASSLTEAFQEMKGPFEADNPQVNVVLVFGGSHILRHQIEAGAKADVFASAHPDHTEALRSSGLLKKSQVFAHSELVVIVPQGDPSSIRDFAGLPRARRIVIGTESVPAGHYARQMLQRSKKLMGPSFARDVRSRVVSEEANVRLVRAKVEMAEADAAIVYRSDVIDSPRLQIIEIPKDVNTRASYTIGVIDDSSNNPHRARWMEWVTSDAGRQVLQGRGFGVLQ
jgi:molybdate transport system substrate-binding protein